MTQIYKCDICGAEYKSKIDCLNHEKKHYKDMSAEERIKLICKNKRQKPCSYCKHVYYEYNCEEICNYMGNCASFNNYRSFELDDFKTQCFGGKSDD